MPEARIAIACGQLPEREIIEPKDRATYMRDVLRALGQPTAAVR